MKKIELEIGNMIQGDFKVKKLNFLLVFQVNCPGCFSHALPLFNILFHEFGLKGVSFLALSTAFEDFDKNTLSNTQELVVKGTLVGETKKMMSQQGYEALPYTLDFPIAIDRFNSTENEIGQIADKICNINPQYAILPDTEKLILKKRIIAYLKSLDKIALTFTVNQLRGTPSYVLFNDQYEILDDWFGHKSYEQISEKIMRFNQALDST